MKERVDPGRDLGGDLGQWLLIMRNSRKHLRIVLDRCLEQKFREVDVLNFVHECTDDGQARALGPLQGLRVEQYCMRVGLHVAQARLLLSIQLQLWPRRLAFHRCALPDLEQIAATVQAVHLKNVFLIVPGTVADIHSLSEPCCSWSSTFVFLQLGGTDCGNRAGNGGRRQAS